MFPQSDLYLVFVSSGFICIPFQTSGMSTVFENSGRLVHQIFHLSQYSLFNLPDASDSADPSSYDTAGQKDPHIPHAD